MELFPHLTIDRKTVRDKARLNTLSKLRSLRGNDAYHTLLAVEAGDVSGTYNQMLDCMTDEQALNFAANLREVAQELAQQKPSDNPKICSTPGGAAEALAALLVAAEWYENVGSLGFGVYVVY